MSKKEYLHAAVRVSYLENQLVTSEDLFRAIDADSAEDAYKILASRRMFKGYSFNDYEKAFENSLTETYELIEKITDQSGITDIFRHPIDGHNYKVLIKSEAADGDYSSLYKSGGTINPEEIRWEFDSRRFYQTPDILSEAAVEAAEKLARIHDSQVVDIIIDKAVIELISEKALNIGCEGLTEYIRASIDIINIKSALRMLRINRDILAVSENFAYGGNIYEKEFEKAYSKGYDGLKMLAEKALGTKKLSEAIGFVKHGHTVGIFENQADRYLRNIFDKMQNTPFGIEPVIVYLDHKIREIKACRFVLVSKLYGLSEEKIADRVRCIYAY